MNTSFIFSQNKMSARTKIVFENAKNMFKKCIRERDIEQIVSMYDKKAVLKGTLSKKPVTGHEEIRKYFEKLLTTVKGVRFDKNPILFQKKDLQFECGRYHFFKTDGEKLTATYQFVIDREKIISHFSSLQK